MIGASRLSCPLRARRFAEAMGHLANRVDALARIGTMFGDLEPVAPQDAFLKLRTGLRMIYELHPDWKKSKPRSGDEGEGEDVPMSVL